MSQQADPYLQALTKLLWPGATTELRTRRPRSVPANSWQYFVLPSLRDPRLLLPVAPRAVAAKALRRFSEHSSMLAKVRVLCFALLVRCGIAEMLLSSRLHVTGGVQGETIERYLQEVLGDVVVSVSVGKPRANRKPVLQVLDQSGRTVAFAKVGVNALTRTLVVAERDALRKLASLDPSRALRLTRVPAVLHAGPWHDTEVLVQSALPVWRRRAAPDRGRLCASMLEVASVDGLHLQLLADSRYWRRLSTRVEALVDSGVHSLLREVCRFIAGDAGDLGLWFGASHGDWTPWNMAYLGDSMLVWDWERFRMGVPLGFDALHYELQDALVNRRSDPFAAALSCIDESAEVLHGLGVCDQREARTTAMLYLVDLAARYSHDGQEAAGARRGDVGTWLLPALLERTRTRTGRR